jgi:VIT1/CCC1 family predicted Fe2+/Mn2+ transporter
MVVGAASLPFLLLRDLTTAAYTAVGIALVVIFIVGAVLGYQSKRNPILKGVRLAGVGLAAYLGITLLEHVL